MASSPHDIAETTASISRRRPVLEKVLRAFEPILRAQKDAAAELVESLRSSGIQAPDFERGSTPLLAGFASTGMGAFIRRSAGLMLQRLFELNTLDPYKEALEKIFAHGPEEQLETFLTAKLSGNSEFAEKLAAKNNIPPEILNFVSDFVFSPVLRALACFAAGNGTAPWDEEGAWSHGHCPVCGSYPSIGWLDRPNVEEANAFLTGGGGKKHLHCASCGANWEFLRVVCPACGKHGDGAIHILRAMENPGERLDWCVACKSYCPIIDLREMEYIPDMDVMAIGMMHLDMVAAEKNLLPLKASFWNMF